MGTQITSTTASTQFIQRGLSCLSTKNVKIMKNMNSTKHANANITPAVIASGTGNATSAAKSWSSGSLAQKNMLCKNAVAKRIPLVSGITWLHARLYTDCIQAAPTNRIASVCLMYLRKRSEKLKLKKFDVH